MEEFMIKIGLVAGIILLICSFVALIIGVVGLYMVDVWQGVAATLVVLVVVIFLLGAYFAARGG